MKEYMYIVYCLEFKTTGKKYIGFTSIGIELRIHKHNLNALSGVDSHLYRAIRLYGLSDITSVILYTSDNKKECLEKEKYYISLFNTISDGYNLTDGGVGGWSVPDDKYQDWKAKIQKKSIGLNNGNSYNILNHEILEYAVKYYISNNYTLTINKWRQYCKKNNLPQKYSTFRFGGGYKNFIIALKHELDKRNITYTNDSFKYKKTIEHRNKLRKSAIKHAKNKKNREENLSI